MGKLRDIIGTLAGSFSIGRNDASVASAALEVSSTSRGILIPRLTSAQIAAISSPANWLEVVDTDLGMRFIYDGTRAKWLSVESGAVYAGRTGNTAVGSFYRGLDGVTLDASNLGIVDNVL